LQFDLLERGLDLRDLWRPPAERVSTVPVTPRLVLTLAEQLPDSSALRASQRGGGEFRPWTTEATLLAAAVNILAAANHQRSGRRRGFEPPVHLPNRRRRGARVVRIADVIARRGGSPPT
jgi:hypothetical protein